MTIPRRTRRLLLTATIGVAGLGAYALLIELRWLQVSHTRIRVSTLHAALSGLRIAVLTDFHAGGGTPLSIVRRACQRAMAEQPDLIALTGDFATDYASSFDAVLDVLACLNAPLGVYAVPGNHDYRVGMDTWQRQFTAAQGIHNLTNRALIRLVNGTRLCIAGVDDFSRGTPRPEVLPPAEQRDFTILLAHNPDQAEHLQGTDDRVDLIVSGHTHGGQVRLPWIGALRNPAHHDDLYEEGLQQRPWAQVYVSRGIGMVSLPIRFLARPEVAILELVRPFH